MLKWFLTLALGVILLGLFLPRQPGRVRRGLPGDVTWRWRGRDYFFPFGSTLVFSVLLALLSRLL
ncbi:hypothetical protein AZSI13_15100 [Azospira sp. I13]|uniref:DUF2905 domain-containing protein n=1 Tax=Azospira sp. I13 TaxID=1765050 RepID=UPI000D4AEB64|nr:DUF2905 domain-containing protein [Azospira sp. I13]GBG02183.1 hypothetical protein AZSI13_15100 [Azospira sp. I13]